MMYPLGLQVGKYFWILSGAMVSHNGLGETFEGVQGTYFGMIMPRITGNCKHF